MGADAAHVTARPMVCTIFSQHQQPQVLSTAPCKYMHPFDFRLAKSAGLGIARGTFMGAAVIPFASRLCQLHLACCGRLPRLPECRCLAATYSQAFCPRSTSPSCAPLWPSRWACSEPGMQALRRGRSMMMGEGGSLGGCGLEGGLHHGGNRVKSCHAVQHVSSLVFPP